MVEKFKEILRIITSEKGEVSLFGMFKMDDITDKWSVILSAPWTESSEKDDSFKYLTGLIQKSLSEEESNDIARVGIFSENEHLVQLLLEYKTGSRIQDEKINGNIIHDGFILESKK